MVIKNSILNTDWIEKYRQATNRLILLDYDGTLVKYEPIPENAVPTLHLLDILKKIIKNPQTRLVIISGRSHNDIDKFLGHLPITLIAEHGAMIKDKGIWRNQIADTALWKQAIIPIFNTIALACPKSFVEEKEFSVVWHYRNAENEMGYTSSRELIRTLEEKIAIYDLKILDGNKVIEVITNAIGKGIATKNLVEKGNYDYILAIGDDKTDEEMFEFLAHNDDARTIKVGEGSTLAKYTLDNVDEVFEFIELL